MSKTTDYVIEQMNNEPVHDRVVPRLYLIRGLPGSGKTTYANSLGCLTFAPSDMMSRRGGEYKWVRENYMISKMHFRAGIRHFMSLQIDIAITEIMPEKKFIEFWLREARDFYYEVHIKTLLVHPEVAIQRNIHGADHKSIYEIHAQFDYSIMNQIVDFSEGIDDELQTDELYGAKTVSTVDAMLSRYDARFC